MRGAAGNLSLVTLCALASNLETAARNVDVALADRQLRDLPRALLHLDALLAHPNSQKASAPLEAVALPSDASAEQLRHWLDATVHALQGGELASEALKALHAHAPGADLLALQEALDAFDFERALECAQALKKKWTPA